MLLWVKTPNTNFLHQWSNLEVWNRDENLVIYFSCVLFYGLKLNRNSNFYHIIMFKVLLSTPSSSEVFISSPSKVIISTKGAVFQHLEGLCTWHWITLGKMIQKNLFLIFVETQSHEARPGANCNKFKIYLLFIFV